MNDDTSISNRQFNKLVQAVNGLAENVRVIGQALLTNRDQAILAAINELSREIKTMAGAVERIEAATTKLVEDVGNVKRVIGDLKTVITELKAAIAAGQLDVAKLEAAATKLEQADTDLDTVAPDIPPVEG